MSKPLVLCHHAVSDTWPAALASTTAQLREQCEHLRCAGYEGRTLARASENGARAVAFTFDDAFLSVWERAKPILDEFGFPATIYVPTGHIGTGRPMRWPGIEEWVGTEHEPELAPMTWDQLRACGEAGWQIGSHSVTHPRLTDCSGTDLAEELRHSRAACEAELGEACTSLAYPYGDHDQRVVEAAKAAGYATAVTLPQSFRSRDPLRIPRVGVYRADDMRRFRLKISPALIAARKAPGWARIAGLARTAIRR